MKLEGYKQELEKLIEYKTKGSIIRSKTRWYNEGEKNTKYFLGLEKRHFNKKKKKKKTIKSLKLENGNSVGSDKKILEEASSFYKKLYTSLRPNPNFCKEAFSSRKFRTTT